MADITQDFVDSNILTAAELNGWKDDRTGSILPIAPSAGASPYNYTGATYDLGSSTYKWRDLWVSRTVYVADSLLVGTVTNTPNSTIYVVTASGSGVSIKTHANNAGLEFIDQYDSTVYADLIQKNQGGVGQSAVDFRLKSAGTVRNLITTQSGGVSYFNTVSGQYLFGASVAVGSYKVEVTGSVYMSSTLSVVGDFAINTNKFSVTASSGNTNVAGTLNSVNDFSVATNKFNVTAASGNVTAAGTILGTQPRASVYNSTNQTITTSTLTVVTFNSEEYDVGGLHSTSSNTGRFTIGVSGMYHIHLLMQCDVEIRDITIYKNGTYIIAKSSETSASVNIRTITALFYLSAGDYIDVQVYHVYGSNRLVNGGDQTTRFSITMLP